MDSIFPELQVLILFGRSITFPENLVHVLLKTYKLRYLWLVKKYNYVHLSYIFFGLWKYIENSCIRLYNAVYRINRRYLEY